METTRSLFPRRQTLTFKGKLLDITTPKVMGIINVSPDSFYSGSRFMMKRRIYLRAKAILNEGGSIIDIGACSTRPGSLLITENEEMKRLSKAVGVVRRRFPDAIISVDTFRSNVARAMVEDFAVDMINDISSGDMDEKMFDTVADLNVPYIAMHMKGTPSTMQNNPQYDNVIKELFNYFSRKVELLNRIGVKDILIDPGFGFGKTLEHNYSILKNLASFSIFNLPLVVGLSRKSMIYKPLVIKPEFALTGTIALNTIALYHGAQILRVHDVKDAVEVIKLVELMKNQPQLH